MGGKIDQEIFADAFLDEVFEIDGYLGETEFGWENTRYELTWDKINFACLQLDYASGRPEWKELMTQVIKDYTGAYEVEYKLHTGYDGKFCGYIDHQSSASEGENTEIFKDYDTLKMFLFGDSYINGGNDNE
jgi:hypothetical protein